MKSNTERVDIADKLTEKRQHGKRRKKRKAADRQIGFGREEARGIT